MVEKMSFSGNPLEQFVLLAKNTKGAACVELIKQVLEAPGVYVFGELLEMPNIEELDNVQYKTCLNTLNLFAFGTYSEYLKDKSAYLELTPGQNKKLKHLTIVTLATHLKCIPYATLLKELDINNVRDLEDLIIEAIYADIIHGKLDQKNSQLEVDCAIGRDIKSEDIHVIVKSLEEWSTRCEGVLSCVETQINRANSEKSRCVVRKADIEQEVINIKKTLKTQVQDHNDGTSDVMVTDNREAAASTEKGKKSSKGKGIRSTSKFWLKS